MRVRVIRSGAGPGEPATISLLHELSQSLETGWRCHQTIANPSPLFADEQVPGDEKAAPFAKRGISFLFKPNSGVDVPFEVEVIVH